jgi:hypothetical protein
VAENGVITLALTDGRVAVVRRPKGRDMRLAGRAVGAAADAIERLYATLAQIVTIDGKPITKEECDEMWADDIESLSKAAKDFLSLLPAQSSSSSSEVSQ